MFECVRCGRLALLIMNECERCAPERHREYQDRLNRFRTVSDHYEAETGRHVLEDWSAFEKWCEKNACLPY